jgi:hypothetical protein
MTILAFAVGVDLKQSGRGHSRIIPNPVERFSKRHPGRAKPYPGPYKAVAFAGDPVSARQHFMPRRARDDDYRRRTFQPDSV